MEHHTLHVLVSSGLAGLATFAGMALILLNDRWSRRHSPVLVSYSAGVLLAVGLLHVFPEAFELQAHAPGFLLAGFLAFYALEHHFFFHASHEELHHTTLEVFDSHDEACRDPHPLGRVAFLGRSRHSLLDGMIIGAGFEADHQLGILASLGVIAHEVPEGIAMLSILLHYGHPRRTAVLFTTVVALATPVGAMATTALAWSFSPPLLGALLAIAAGSFIYVAASDLIPESHRARGFPGSLALLGGIGTALLAGWVAH